MCDGALKILFCIPCLLLIVGCTRVKQEELPPDEVLIDLLCDLHLAESSMTRVPIEKQDSISDVLRARIARSHGIAPDQIDLWLEILQKSPDHLMTVYDSVIVRLERSTPQRSEKD